MAARRALIILASLALAACSSASAPSAASRPAATAAPLAAAAEPTVESSNVPVYIGAPTDAPFASVRPCTAAQLAYYTSHGNTDEPCADLNAAEGPFPPLCTKAQLGYYDAAESDSAPTDVADCADDLAATPSDFAPGGPYAKPVIVTIATLSGTTDKNGKPFTYDGVGDLTLSYTVKGGSYAAVVVYVWPKGDAGNAGFPIVSPDGPGKGSTALDADSEQNAMAGDYYIMVLSANASWTVTITETR